MKPCFIFFLSQRRKTEPIELVELQLAQDEAVASSLPPPSLRPKERSKPELILSQHIVDVAAASLSKLYSLSLSLSLLSSFSRS
jgi:hypothetical protein